MLFRWFIGKYPPAGAGDTIDLGPMPELGRSPRGEMATHSNILSWEIHGQRGLVGYSLWSCKELDMTEDALMHYIKH